MDVIDPDAIYWHGLCDNRSIYDAFWSYQLTVNASEPRLTKCFAHTVMIWVPQGFLLLSLLLYIPYVSQSPIIHRLGSISKLNLSKMILGSFLIFMSALSLGDIMSRYSSEIVDEQPNLASGIGIIIQIVGLFVAEVVTYWIYRRGQHTSGVLFIYWLLLLITCALRVGTDILEGPQKPPGTTDLAYTLFYVFSGLVCIQFFLNIPADVSAMKKVKKYRGRSVSEQQPLLGDKPTITPTNPCPKNSANFLSLLFYTWFMRLVITGYKRTLQYSDIWDIRDQDSSETNLTKFIRDWEAELIKNGYSKDQKGNVRIGDQRLGNPKLWKVLWKSIGKTYATGGIISLAWAFIELVNPQILNGLIAFVEGGDQQVWHGYLMAFVMFAMSMISVLLLHNGFDFCYNVGMRLRTITVGAIYRKALKLSSCGRLGAKSAGEITNMMSVDAQKMQDTLLWGNQLWISPLVVSVGTYLLWQKLGVASLAGLAVYAFLIPGIAILTSKFMRTLQMLQMKLKDSRIKLMNQILNGIKVLKLYAWESYFENRIKQIRAEEVTYLKHGSFISTINMTVSYSASFMASLLMFLTYIFTDGGGVLPPDVAFVSLALMNSLSFSIIIIPTAVMNLIQGAVSLNRIQDFLLAEEIDSSSVTHVYDEDGPIRIKDGTFTWGTERVILQDINVLVPDQKLVAVVGHVGSGKSSFISSILGEMIRTSGSVNVDGKVAYVPQQAWIQNLTVRDNILFTESYVRAKYNEVLDACALTEDLKILAGGDMTEIGERGINLSGGQKQRVSLARAVYQNSDIYLLDDPLSAVDAHVGKHIFDNVIGPTGWLRNKTRVLVTNAVTFLPKTDLIIVLKDGQVTEQGTFEDLIARQGAFSEFVAIYLKEAEEEMGSDDDSFRMRHRLGSLSSSLDSISTHSSIGSLPDLKNDKESVELLRRLSSMIESTSESRKMSTEKRTSEQRRKSSARKRVSMLRAMEEDQQKKANTLIIEETAEEGSIKPAVLKRYIKAARLRWSLVVVIGVILMIGGTVGSNIWLSDWSNDSILDAEAAAGMVSLRLGIYSTLGAATVSGITLVMVGVIYGTVAASTKMHNDLLNNVLKSPMSFFDTTPLGRLINRFSKDVDTMDVELRMYIQMWISQFAPIIATIIIISYSTPIFIVVVIPLVILFAMLQRVYVKTARQIKRIDSIKRSPVYNNFSETLNGLSSIRAYRQQPRFIKHADVLLDNNQKVWFAVYSSNRWIGVLSQNLGNMVVFFAALFCVISRDTIDAGTVGMSLTFAMQVGIQIVMVLRTTCELETYIVSVERVAEYTETPQEAPWRIDGVAPPAKWPATGMVKFDGYGTKYREGLDLVLKGVDCFIHPEEKVGVVGRTGAGKSSMTLALFRIIEAAMGSIYIDDVNIANLGLHDIRSKLTIIPQDPVVFSGTLRFNIDPAEEFREVEVWKALEQAHLKRFVQTLKEGLDYECGEEGANLSVGQRQLVCLARALLRRTKILILDEATAAVDLETDDLIQETIRTAFKDCTVITIAHRLNTIMDTDRVMVLDKGTVKEFDSPKNLLGNEETIFHKMARDAGII